MVKYEASTVRKTPSCTIRSYAVGTVEYSVKRLDVVGLFDGYCRIVSHAVALAGVRRIGQEDAETADCVVRFS